MCDETPQDDRAEPTTNHTTTTGPCGDGTADAPDDRYPTESDDGAPSGVTPGAGEVPTDAAAIRRAFDAAGVATVDADDVLAELPSRPPARDVARIRWPPAVCDGATVPDPHYTPPRVTVPITVPAWALATAAHRFRDAVDRGRVDDPADAEHRVRDVLHDCTNLWLDYRTPGGADAVDAILATVDLERRDAGD
jgi:hypothetical protein